MGPDGFDRGVTTTYFIATFSGTPDAGYSHGEISEVPQSDHYSRHPGVPKLGPKAAQTAYAILTELNATASDYRQSKDRATDLRVVVDGITKVVASLSTLT